MEENNLCLGIILGMVIDVMVTLKGEVWVGIFLIVFSLVFFIQSFSLPYSGLEGIGAGFFPTWLSGILLILSVCYIYSALRREDSQSEPMPKGKALLNILFILLCMIGFIILVTFLGFVITSTLFLFVLLYRNYRWYMNIGISLGISLVIFFVFNSLLGVTLPVNGFGW